MFFDIILFFDLRLSLVFLYLCDYVYPYDFCCIMLDIFFLGGGSTSQIRLRIRNIMEAFNDDEDRHCRAWELILAIQNIVLLQK